MTDFQRRSRWLSFLFPASTLPRERDPGSLSSDVSLVQIYADGLGFANDVDWFRFIITAAAAAGDVVVFTTSQNVIFRFLAASVTLLAGAGTVGRLDFVGVTPSPGQVIGSSTESAINGSGKALIVQSPIVGPGTQVRFRWDNGDAATSVLVAIYGFEVPLGTNLLI